MILWRVREVWCDCRIGTGEGAIYPNVVTARPTIWPTSCLYARGDCSPKQGKLLRSIWSSKAINCLESPFFSVSESIQQWGLLSPAAMGSVWHVPGLSSPFSGNRWLIRFSRESHTQLSKLSHWTIPFNNLCWCEYTHTHRELSFAKEKEKHISFLLRWNTQIVIFAFVWIIEMKENGGIGERPRSMAGPWTAVSLNLPNYMWIFYNAVL